MSRWGGGYAIICGSDQFNILLYVKRFESLVALFLLSTMDESTNNERFKVLTNGAVYDNSLKRIVSGASLSSDGARALVQKRIDKRREIVKNTANQHAKAGEFKSAGDAAYLAAIISAAMDKATNPSDPKAIEAGRFVIESAGDNESVGPGGDSSVEELRGLVREIAELARALSAADPITDSGPLIIEAESI